MKEKNMNIKYSNGTTATALNLNAAIADVLLRIGGGVSEIGDDRRTLIWRTALDADNDDGSRAVAVITA